MFKITKTISLSFLRVTSLLKVCRRFQCFDNLENRSTNTFQMFGERVPDGESHLNSRCENKNQELQISNRWLIFRFL